MVGRLRGDNHSTTYTNQTALVINAIFRPQLYMLLLHTTMALKCNVIMNNSLINVGWFLHGVYRLFCDFSITKYRERGVVGMWKYCKLV